jgi:hypothetical protein
MSLWVVMVSISAAIVELGGNPPGHSRVYLEQNGGQAERLNQGVTDADASP